VIATLLAYISPLVDPKFNWVLSFFGLFYPVFLIFNILFILFWLLKKNSNAWISIVCLVLGWGYINSFFGFNKVPNSDIPKNSLGIVSYNISNASFRNIKSTTKTEKQENKEKVIQVIKSFNEYDILCIQEAGDYAIQILKKELPKHKLFHTEKGSIILSKFPILNKGVIDFGTVTNSCLWADLQYNDLTIRVYSFHLQSNRVSKDAEMIAQNIQLKEKVNWYDIKGILRKFRKYHKSRTEQIEMIAQHAKSCPHPYILAGDLNDPPLSYTYKVLSDIANDAFREKGRGIGTTYAGTIPLLRIDYIFYSDDFECLNFNIPHKDISDHYPILSNIKVK